MAYHTTILRQIIDLFPRHEFESIAKDYHRGQKFRSFNRWSQFLILFIGQVSGRRSLRDLVINITAQAPKFYHLGIKQGSRATLARANERQPAELYKALFYKLLQKTKLFAPKHRFKFNCKLYLLDATVIDLCLSAFPWATFRQSKGAAKLHIGLDGDGYLTEFVDLTGGKTHKIAWARTLNLPKGSMAVFDLGYTDYDWYSSLTINGIKFVTRLKTNAKIKGLNKRRGRRSPGVRQDATIQLGDIPEPLRMIVYYDEESDKEYRFVSNAHDLTAQTIAELYKERWQVETFFKWIKGNLRVKSFLGTSRNAVLTQIWIALIVYLLLAFLTFKSKLRISMQQMLRVLQLNLFERRYFTELFKPPEPQLTVSPQTSMLDYL